MVNGILLTLAVLLLVAFCIVWWPAALLAGSATFAGLLRIRILNQTRAGERR